MCMVIEPARPPSSRMPPLGAGEVHVWKVDLDDGSDTTSLIGFWSEQERGRARRFHQMRDSSRYLVAHGTLRVILGGYLAVHPEAITFAVTSYGKPYLVPPPGRIPISFNLSYSGGLAVIGIASGLEVGIDVERVDTRFPILETARHVLTDTELALLAVLPEELKIPVFYRFWTMKEAFLKWAGTGITRQMNRFKVSPLPRKPAYGGQTELPEDADYWIFPELPLIPGYAGALVVGTKPSTVRFFETIPQACFPLECCYEADFYGK